MPKLTKKLGSFKKGEKYFVTDPENADRILHLGEKKFVFTHDAIEKIEVTGEEATALKQKYGYLKVEKA